MDVRTLTFTGAGSKTLGGGLAFVLLSTTSEVDVTFKRNGTEVYKAENVEGGFSVNFLELALRANLNDLQAYAFNEVQITASAANTVKYGISRDGLGSFNQFSGSVILTSGTLTGITNNVNITDDTLYNRTNNGEEFIGVAKQGNATSNYAHVQLKNPTGSGVTIIVRKIHIYSENNMDDFRLYRYDTDLTTLSINGVNKNIGGAAGQGEIRVQNSTSILGSNIKVRVGQYNQYENKVLLSPEDSPIILGEGEGIVSICVPTNASNITTYHWSEK